MRWSLLALVLFVMVCGKTASQSTPIAEPTLSPAAAEASTKPFAVNPDPDPPRGMAVLTAVRAATHPEAGGWDRIVFEFKADLSGAEIEYIDEAVGCGSGQHIALPSSAILQVRFQSAQAHTDAGKPTIQSSIGAVGPALLAAKQTCDFEGETTWALAISSKRPFVVTTLKAPTRMVIDIQH
jgi:hypothetical protein